MAAKMQQVSEDEAAYLVCENATELWGNVYGGTRCTRRPMESISQEVHHRLLYLTAAAVYRSVQSVLRKKSWKTLLDTIEAYADGRATPEQLEAAHDSRGLFSPKMSAAAVAVADSTDLLLDDYKVLEGVDFITDAMGHLGAIKAGVLPKDIRGGKAVWKEPSFLAAKQAHEKLLCGLIRDIFGNPYRPVRFDPKWRTEAATGIAAKMYEEKDVRAMPILADALEEAGCGNETILSHCREPGTHVRGCWVVDLVLGKE